MINGSRFFLSLCLMMGPYPSLGGKRVAWIGVWMVCSFSNSFFDIQTVDLLYTQGDWKHLTIRLAIGLMLPQHVTSRT